MNRNKELVRNSLLMTIGKISTQMVSFLLLPLYTGILTTTEYGTVDLINTYQQLLIYVVFLQMENSIFRFLVDRRSQKERWSETISTALTIVMISSGIFTVLFALLQNLSDTPQIVFLWTNVMAASFSGMMLQVARGMGQNKDFVMGSFLSAVSTILFNILFVALFRWGASGMLAAICLGNLVCTGYLIIRCRVDKYISLRAINKALGKEMLKYAIPMIPNALAWWVISASDRSVVLLFLGASYNGVLAVAHKFSTMYFAVYHMFNLSWTESAVLHLQDEDRNEFFSDVINRSLGLFWSIGIGIMAVMPFVFGIFVNQQYAAAYEQIPLLLLGTMINTVQGVYSTIYIAAKETGKLAKSTVAAAIINVVAGVMLIRYIELYAAPVSTIVAYAAITLHRCRDTRRHVQVTLDKRKVTVVLAMLTATLLTYYFGNKLAQAASLAAVAIAAFWLNKPLVKGAIKGIAGKLKLHK